MKANHSVKSEGLLSLELLSEIQFCFASLAACFTVLYVPFSIYKWVMVYLVGG